MNVGLSDITEKLGTFALAVVIGIFCLVRINGIDSKIEEIKLRESSLELRYNNRSYEIEKRLSNVITSNNSTVPSELTLKLNDQIKSIISDVEWLKKTRPNEDDFKEIIIKLSAIDERTKNLNK